VEFRSVSQERRFAVVRGEPDTFWHLVRFGPKALRVRLYEVAKVVHLMAVIVWMAGMFGLVHFFARRPNSATAEEVEELLHLDDNWTSPGMLLAWTLGLWMAWKVRWWSQAWFVVKFLMAIVVSALHGILVGRVRRMAVGQEVPTNDHRKRLPLFLCAVILTIITMVIIKPI